jgi:hypothetical protein
MSSNNNQGDKKSQDNLVEVIPNIAKIHPSIMIQLIKPFFMFIVFLAIGYYTLWMSANYVKRDAFESYTAKQDQLLNSRFDLIQNRLESILNQQIVTSEQFKNLNLILNSQQKSLDTLNDRLTFLERNYFKSSKDDVQTYVK